MRAARRKELLRRLVHRAADDDAAASAGGVVWPPGTSAHPSLLEAVRDLSAAEAERRAPDGGPTLRELVREATDRKRAALWAWDHDEAHPDGVPAADPAPDPHPEAAWRHEREAFARASRGVQERLAAADDRLLDRVIPGADASVADIALELATFDAYCAGRATVLRAVAGDDTD